MPADDFVAMASDPNVLGNLVGRLLGAKPGSLPLAHDYLDGRGLDAAAGLADALAGGGGVRDGHVDLRGGLREERGGAGVQADARRDGDGTFCHGFPPLFGVGSATARW